MENFMEVVHAVNTVQFSVYCNSHRVLSFFLSTLVVESPL